MNKATENALNKYRKLSVSSLTTYKNSIKLIASAFKKKKLSANWVNNNIDALLKWVEDERKKQTQKVTSLTAICIILSPKGAKQPKKAHSEAYNKTNMVLKKTNGAYQNSQQKQERKSKDEDNWVDYQELSDYIETIEGPRFLAFEETPSMKTYRELQQVVLFRLYHFSPPRRLSYAPMTVVNEKLYKNITVGKREKSYLVVKSKTKMYFSFGAVADKSKVTTKDYVIVDVPIETAKLIYELITSSLRNDLTWNNTSFLVNTKMNPMTKTTLNKELRKIFKDGFDKVVGVSLLRKMYWSEKKKNDMPLKEAMKIAEAMNHSLSTAQLHYVKKF